MFADKIINETLLDGQMGLLTRNSYLVHHANWDLTTGQSSNSYSVHSQSKTAKNLLEVFSYNYENHTF